MNTHVITDLIKKVWELKGLSLDYQNFIQDTPEFSELKNHSKPEGLIDYRNLRHPDKYRKVELIKRYFQDVVRGLYHIISFPNVNEVIIQYAEITIPPEYATKFAYLLPY